MDWGAIIQLTMAIGGGALIAGGIIAYRGNPRGMARSVAAAVAAGAVMLVVVGLTVTVSSTSDGQPDPVIELSRDIE